MNVAYHLQKFGVDTALISRVGEDDRGTALIKILQNNNVDTAFIQFDKEYGTGVVTANVTDTNEMQYDIVQPVAWDFIEWKGDLSTIVHNAAYFIHGSLAARNTQTYKTLMELREVATTKVVDINLRPPYIKRSLTEELLTGAGIVKLNEHELNLITGWYKKLATEQEQLLFLQDKFSVPEIIVTKGSAGADACINGTIFHHAGYRVAVADTVGSGDAFLAAFLYKTIRGATTQNALQYANATGAFIASQQGACPDYPVSDIEHMVQS